MLKTNALLRASALTVAISLVPANGWGTSAKDVFSKVAASVVVVLAIDKAGGTTAQGSGVVVGPYAVVTNCHVVAQAASLAVRQAADKSAGASYRMTASLLARSENRDLCLLFVEELPDPPAAKVARLGTARSLSVGEEVYAVGAPAGLELTLSRGIVSQLRGAIGKRSAPLVQTDAAISSGSSGGGLFNQASELVGITTFKRRGENLNFAMPVEWVKDLKTKAQPRVGKATAQAVCAAKPSFDCVIGLALDIASNPDVTTFRADLLLDIGTIQADARDAVGAKRTLRDAFEAAPRVFLYREFFAKLAIAQTNLGDAQASKHTLSTLRTLVDQRQAPGPLAAAFAQMGQIRQATKFALRIDGRSRERILALAEVAVAQADAGDVAAAKDTALSIHEDYLRNQALANIAHMEAKKGDYRGALETVTRISDETARIGALTAVSSWQLSRGDYTAAAQTIDSQTSSGVSSVLLRAISTIIQARRGDFAVARTIADGFNIHDTNERAIRVALLNEIATLQARAGDGHAATRTLEAALKTAKSGSDMEGRAVLVSTVAAAQAIAGDTRAARRSFDEAAELFKAARKVEPTDMLVTFTLSHIAQMQAKAGFTSMAVKTALKIPPRYGSSHERFAVRALLLVARYLTEEPPPPWWYPRRTNFFWVWD